MDEIESLLNHFDSPTVKDKLESFGIFETIIECSKKIIALDADFSNRTFTFSKFEKDFTILENTYLPIRKHYIFTGNHKNFYNEIKDSLKKGNKICVITMSADLGTQLNNEYKNKYKTILHTSKTDDELKDKLENVNKLWYDRDMIIYIPCVGAGIDCTLTNIDKIFIILSSNSCSQRDLCQMVNRIRYVKSANINVYLNKLPFLTNSPLYTYDNIEYYHNTTDGLFENEYKTKIKKTLFYIIQKYNEVEKLNKK